MGRTKLVNEEEEEERKCSICVDKGFGSFTEKAELKEELKTETRKTPAGRSDVIKPRVDDDDHTTLDILTLHNKGFIRMYGWVEASSLLHHSPLYLV